MHSRGRKGLEGGGADELNEWTSTANGDARFHFGRTGLECECSGRRSRRGSVFAREACITCHVVEPTNASPRVVVIGPNFEDIANTKGMTATALRVFLTTSHPKMPNLILTPEDTTDVIAYILSLREHQ
jgi:hypothetical protein